MIGQDAGRLPVAGMLLIDKPAGWSSHDCLVVLRKLLPRGVKVGHTGTLDPLATGLLVSLIGPCTKLQARLQGMDKVYSGTIRLGVKTDTGDITGKTLAERPIPALDLKHLHEELAAFVGVVKAPAPAYSAVKHQGRPLYDYARRGLEVPIKPRTATVYEWKALSWSAPELTHRLHCASGTYVRTLAEVIGDKIGCGGTVSALRRESVGPFQIADALPLDVIRALSHEELARRLRASLPVLEFALKKKY